MEKEKFNQIKYNNEFNRANYDRISLMLPKGKKEELKQVAQDRGLKSVNALIIAAIEKFIKSD